MRLVRLGTALFAVVLAAEPGRAQTADATRDPAAATAVARAQVTDPPATLVYANRPIVEFRATALSRTPVERVAAATLFIDRLVDNQPRARVTTRPVADAVIINLGESGIFAILPGDVNTLAGETLAQTAEVAAVRLERAFDEAVELRTPRRLLLAGLWASGATVLFVGLVWGLGRSYRTGRRRLSRTTERQLEKLEGGGAIVRASRLPEVMQRAFGLLSFLVGLVITYSWLTFVLRQFPYTRPWGESLRGALMATGLLLARRVIDSLPDMLTVVIIAVATRFVVRLSNYVFEAVEHQRLVVGWLSPEIAQPTRRIVAAFLWLFALVVGYPYLPGANSDAFKGVTVFAGLMVSLGSSGIMNQVMSGLTITYSRALRVGDFVKVGDVEGRVEHLGALSLKIQTERREAVTIPNALVVSASTINYSRLAEHVQVPTSVTIGYDTPWRQVEALLVLAAERTAGLRKAPRPVVFQTALLDFYVQYTLLVCLEEPCLRVTTLHTLHANILDAFNEYGVQITSPNYEADPDGAKVVPRSQWYAAPAVQPADSGRGTVGV